MQGKLIPADKSGDPMKFNISKTFLAQKTRQIGFSNCMKPIQYLLNLKKKNISRFWSYVLHC